MNRIIGYSSWVLDRRLKNYYQLSMQVRKADNSFHRDFKCWQIESWNHVHIDICIKIELSKKADLFGFFVVLVNDFFG